MSETCYLCGKTCEQVTEYLEGMLTEFQGRPFEGLSYGPFQNCLNNMKSRMFLMRKLEQRTQRLKELSDRYDGLIAKQSRSSDDESLKAELKFVGLQVDSANKEIADLQTDIARKQHVIDDFLDVHLEEFQTRNGYVIKLCPVCMGIAKNSSVAQRRR